MESPLTIAIWNLLTIECMDITHGLLSNAMMNKIMGVAIVDKDNAFLIVDTPY